MIAKDNLQKLQSAAEAIRQVVIDSSDTADDDTITRLYIVSNRLGSIIKLQELEHKLMEVSY